jgi:uncharacterized cupin superfamily protein
MEDEFAFILDGEGDAWIDGHLHRVTAGDAVAFPAGTGIAHSFLNNGNGDLRLMVIGQRNVPGNRLFYPLHPDVMARIDNGWSDAPRHRLGPHDGKPARRR